MQPSTTNNRKQDQQALDFPTDFDAIQKRVEAIRPKRYAKTRNFINGDVTYLSPYISRGVISTKYVLDFLKAEGYKKYEVEKFVQELAWRDYWQTLWKDQGENINQDFKRPQPDVKHHNMVAAVDQAETGIDAIDSAIEQLYTNGYMHNHIRMYTAAITCNQGGAHWKQPARWMYYHLLDGDWASNALSWQWVAGSNAGKKYIANQDNINKYTFSKQKGTFLDVTYEELAALEQPSELAASSDWNLETPLPKPAELQIDESLPTAVYNYYNLDPQWLDDQDMNRIMLWEPEVFEQYPIGQKAVDFAMALGENIPNLQHFVGSFNALEANLGVSKIHYKEHPLNTDYSGTEHPRDWMTSVQGTHRSFFAFWKKAEKELRF